MRVEKEKFETRGHEGQMPPLEVPDKNGNMIPVIKYWEIRKSAGETEAWVWDLKEKSIRNHFEKIMWADAILVLNYGKKDTENYIGANTFLEMGIAFHERKQIYLLNPIPEVSNKEEILGMKPIVINGDLSLLN